MPAERREAVYLTQTQMEKLSALLARELEQEPWGGRDRTLMEAAGLLGFHLSQIRGAQSAEELPHAS